MGAVWDSLQNRLCDMQERESPGKCTDCLGVPTRLILDMHTFNLHLLVTRQNHVCDFSGCKKHGGLGGNPGRVFSPSCELVC